MGKLLPAQMCYTLTHLLERCSRLESVAVHNTYYKPEEQSKCELAFAHRNVFTHCLIQKGRMCLITNNRATWFGVQAPQLLISVFFALHGALIVAFIPFPFVIYDVSARRNKPHKFAFAGNPRKCACSDEKKFGAFFAE